MVVAEMLEKEALQIEFQFEVCVHMAEVRRVLLDKNSVTLTLTSSYHDKS